MANRGNHIEMFLEKFPPESAERHYYQAVLDLLSSIDILATELSGFGCMLLLYMSTIELKDGRVIGEDTAIMGSIEDTANAVAVLLPSLHHDPIWWKANYPSQEANPLVATEAKRLLLQIKKSELVKQVKTFLS